MSNEKFQDEHQSHADTIEYVTVMISGQLFGLPISRAEDVFMLQRVTAVPLAPPEVSGVLNLRGRIVTAIDMRVRLGVKPREDGGHPCAVGVEYKGESYGLIIDRVGEVLRLREDAIEQNPSTLDPRWASVARGVYQLEGKLMVVLDVDQVLDIVSEKAAA